MKEVTKVSELTIDNEEMMDFDMGKRPFRNNKELEELISDVLLKSKSGGFKCGGCLYGWFRPVKKDDARKHIKNSHGTYVM